MGSEAEVMRTKVEVMGTEVVTAGGNYTVTVSSGNGCTASASVTVTLFPDPPAAITPSVNVNICLGDTVHFTATTGIGYTYQWLKNSVSIGGATNSYYDAITNGFYSCSITDSNFCDSVSASVKVRIICLPPIDPELKTGIENSNTDNPEFFVFYHSSLQEVLINAQKLKGENYLLRVLDIIGKTVYSISGNADLTYFTREISCAAFAKGMYIISLQTEKEKLVKKFVKE